MLELIKAKNDVLDSLISESNSLISFEDSAECFSAKDLIRLGETLDSESELCGAWQILSVDNGTRSVARLLYLLSAGKDVLIVSDNLSDSVLNQLKSKVRVDAGSYQSMQRIGLLTSGTTGTPKIVVHDASRIARKCALNASLIYAPRNFRKIACPLSLSFGHGLIGLFLSSLVAAERIWILRNNIQSISRIPKLVESEGIDFLSSVPSMWKVIRPKENQLNSLTVGFGSSYLPSYLASRVFEAGAKSIINFYGLTELSNWIGFKEAKSSPDELYSKDGNALFTLYPDVRWDLTKEEVSETSDLESCRGELALKHETMLLGYLGHQYPETNAGYYRTSDIFQGEACSNTLEMLGRDSFYVKRGGHRIHLTQIDSAISSLNMGIETVTVNVEDSYKEEAIVVTLVETEDEQLLEVVCKRAKDLLPASCHPNYFIAVDSLPRTERGKVDYQKCSVTAKGNV